MPRPPAPAVRSTLLTLFAVSGFCGLIYESIWSHYLRLMLGHAAYAQTVVLAIFMGGMALGAWVASRHSERWRRPLIAYAAVEAVVGLAALWFHELFVRLLDLLYLQWIPALAPAQASMLKWTLAAGLILPPSALLGATFPLMSAAILRRDPRRPGATLALLYFTNSIGAVAGVLVSGFVLIPRVGLPGTIALAGTLNLALACAVWALARRTAVAEPTGPMATPAPAGARIPALLLTAAFVTGAASFFYEIAWIRMLSLVLGTTNQAFELMLSAFILGLALGGLWIRRRVDRQALPLRFAGHVQILMGCLAVATLPVYGLSFDLMGYLVRTLDKTDRGYALFHLGSHAIALVVMLPATVLAGMTLPLFTYALLRQGYGERSIGRVYASNTVGAICGVLLAVHWVMPALGTKGVIVLAAVADVALGAVLLASCRERLRAGELRWSVGLAAALLLAITVGVGIDPRRAASGVYRTGLSEIPSESEVLYHRDGKTATVALIRDSNGWMRITTNGKPDAQINAAGGAAAADEATMVLLAALPLALRPRSEVAANIGMGSGMTTHVLLGSDRIRRVDTIEIEQTMVEAARAFGPLVERAYRDPRSQIHIQDAKTFFAGRATRYDLIISEPSNPWVSGVASLFSEEFYRHVRTHLATDGVLVQWLQLYETNVDLLAAVFKALATEFDDYVVFNTDNANILVAATNGRALGSLDGSIFDHPALRRDLARVGIHGVEDLEIRRIGSRATLHAAFAALPAPSNTDYFPYLSHEAPKSRFLGQNAAELTRLHVAPVPVLELLDPYVRRGVRPVTNSDVFAPAAARHWAEDLLDAVSARVGLVTTAALHREIDLPDLFPEPEGCGADRDEAALREAAMRLAGSIHPFLAGDRPRRFWRSLIAHPCYADISTYSRNWLELHRAVAAREGRAMARLAGRLLDSPPEPLSRAEVEYLVGSGMAGALAAGRLDEARRFQKRFEALYRPERTPPFYLRLLLAQAQ